MLDKNWSNDQDDKKFIEKTKAIFSYFNCANICKYNIQFLIIIIHIHTLFAYNKNNRLSEFLIVRDKFHVE